MSHEPTHITTGQVRLSYAHLFKPAANAQGGDPKFSVTILLPKTDVAAKARLDAAVQAAKQLGVQTKWGGKMPAVLDVPIYDGDGVRPSSGESFGPECRGCWVFTARANADRAPEIVDVSLNPIINQSEVYSGIYARVSLDLYPYAHVSGKRGIGISLGNVQKLADGEPLAGQRPSAEDDFGGAAAAPQAPAYMQQAAPAAPQQPQYQPQPAYPPQPQYPVPGAQPAYYPAQQPQYPVVDPITGLPV